ncbi:MAG: ferritin [Flavobacteriaceae bacterium]|jgi:ferritin
MKEQVEKALNEQILKEGQSSHFYLSMASWSEAQGLSGTSTFMYKQSEEERFHMLKLLRFVNERGGRAIIPELSKPQADFDSVLNIFELLLSHEIQVTESINNLVDVCLINKDYTTHNFIQWYLSEQLEEEAQARTILDKVRLIGDDKAGLYLFDRDLENAAFQVDPANTAAPGA